jgi:flagellar hook assembly protein FlgD
MTAIAPIAATGMQNGSTVSATERKTTLDSEVFLKLLVTQLSNQDPSSPMNTNEMLAQTTQLASMEQLTAIAGTTTESFALGMRQTAAALVGREAQYIDEAGATHTGVVTSVSFAGSVPLVQIGDVAVPLDAVAGITLPS